MKHAILALFVAALGCGSPSPGSPSLAPDALEISVDGRTLTFELQTNDRLFAPDFARYQWRDGALERVAGVPADAHCYRLGRSGQSAVAVHACSSDASDLTGVLVHEGAIFDLEAGLDGVVVVEPAGKSGSCGFDGVPAAPVAVPNISPTRPELETRHFALEQIRFIESIVVTDSGWNAARNGGVNVADPIMTAHATAAIYDGQPFNERLLPILTGVVDLGGSNPWGDPQNGRVNSDPYLDAFNGWLAASESELPPFDHAALMTGYDMGNIIGLAVFEGSCYTEYAGALVYSIGSNAYATMTMSHEFGHLIGMDHDETAACPPDTFVMTSSYYEEGPFPTDFSPCSMRDANAFLATSAFCLDAQSGDTYPEPRCGDGKVEGNEQCDCGPDGCEGRDPCCNEATCRLNSGAACSVAGGCCDASTCQPHSADAGVQCRPPRGACDVAEVCDGGTFCPPDKVSLGGTTCTDDAGWRGACYLGDCVTRGATCEYLADFYVLDDPPYAEMCGVDAECGPMECLGDGQCLVTQEAAPDGTTCGAGLQCFDGECVPASALPGGDGCAEPQRDSDGDGTRDCDDECPYDPSTTSAPCGVQPEPSNNADADAGDPQTDPDRDMGMGEEDDVVIVKGAEEGGCSMGVAGPSSWWVIALSIFFHRPRR